MRPGGLIYVVTGERGSGKSTVCARVVREAAERGLTVAGILTERVEPGQGASRRVVDLRSGESRPFGAQDRSKNRGPDDRAASAVPPASAGSSISTDPLTPGWEFDSEVFLWANEVLSRSTPCDLLVVDEVGPLELLGGRGWVNALEVMRSGDFRAALVVCRPGLLTELWERLGEAPGAVFEVSPETRGTMPGTILRGLLQAGSGA